MKLGSFEYIYPMESLRISLFQIPLQWENPEANRLYIRQQIEQMTDTTDLIVLPEMFTTGFTMQATSWAEPHPHTTVAWMQKLAAAANSLLIGSIIVEENNHYYNRLYAVQPDGKMHYYDKRHLFSYAGENRQYSAGTKKLVFEYQGWKICPLICYDLRFPVWSRNTENFDLLIYIANWPESRVAAWDQLLPARAIENICYTAGVNRVGTDKQHLPYPGHSGVWDPLGQLLTPSSSSPAIITTQLDKNTLQKTREKFRFLEDRDSFTIQ